LSQILQISKVVVAPTSINSCDWDFSCVVFPVVQWLSR